MGARGPYCRNHTSSVSDIQLPQQTSRNLGCPQLFVCGASRYASRAGAGAAPRHLPCLADCGRSRGAIGDVSLTAEPVQTLHAENTCGATQHHWSQSRRCVPGIRSDRRGYRAAVGARAAPTFSICGHGARECRRECSKCLPDLLGAALRADDMRKQAPLLQRVLTILQTFVAQFAASALSAVSCGDAGGAGALAECL